MGMDGMNLSTVHVIYNQCSILPNKENEILFWVNCNHSVLLITKLRTNFNIHASKQFLHVHNMLQNPVISISLQVSTLKAKTYCENQHSTHPGDPKLDGWTFQHHLVYELSSISFPQYPQQLSQITQACA